MFHLPITGIVGGENVPPLPVLEDFEINVFSDTTAPTANAPAGITVGELLFVCFNWNTGSGGSFTYFNTPAGWNRGPETQSMEGNGFEGQFFVWKIADGTEGNLSLTAHSGTNKTGVAYYGRVSGVDAANPIQSITTRGNTNSGSTRTCETITNTENCLGLGFLVNGGDNPLSVSGTGWTELDETLSGTAKVSFSKGELTTPGIWTPTFTGGLNQRRSALTVVVNPDGFTPAYTFPVLEGYQRSSTASSTTSFNCVAPSGITAGELLVIGIVSRANAPGVTHFNTPSGWTLVNQVGTTTEDVKVGIFYKIADGTEGNVTITITSTSFATVAWYMRVSGVDAADPLEAQNSDLTGSSGPHNHVYPNSSITTANDNCWEVVVYGISDNEFPVGIYGNLTNPIILDSVTPGSTLMTGISIGEIGPAGFVGPVMVCTNIGVGGTGDQAAVSRAAFNAA